MDSGSRQGPLPTGDLTMLFSDIEGSTRLLHEIGETYGDVLEEHHRVLREAWAAHGGLEVHADGDAFLVVFGEARNAVRAAAAAQGALASHSWPHRREVRVRMGIHTGNAQVRHDDYWGIDVHYAARLCAAAHGGQVLLSATTRAIAADAAATDLGEHALKDFPAPRTIFHLDLPGRTVADFPPPRTLEVVRSNLPSVATRIVGRAEEIASVREQFEKGTRLLTITGIGGSGKTRLALACGEALLPRFVDGAFLVSLASIRDEERVALAIGAAVGAQTDAGRDAEEDLIDYLRDRDLLLILDNMEHLLGATPLLSRIVAETSNPRVLATSQTPLRLQGEVVVPLDTLAVPPEGEHDPAELGRWSAVELFSERARAADPAFALRDDNAAAVAEICRRLDGLPLALELAAARIRIGGPAMVLGLIERGIDSLGAGARDLPERQRGLRAALDWTVSLLSEDERRLFAALAAFADAWTIEQLDRMFAGELDVWEGCASLIDFSLIRTRGDGRFTMAEAIRTYARELLDSRGEGDDARGRHAAVLAGEAEVICDEFIQDFHRQKARTIDLMREFSVALAWAKLRDAELHRRLVSALAKPYYFARDQSELRDDVTALAAADEGLDRTSVRLFLGNSLVVGSSGDMEGSANEAARAVECARRIGDERAEALALIQEAHMRSFLGPDDIACGFELLDAAGRLPAVAGDRSMRNVVEGAIAINLIGARRVDEAEALLREIEADPTRTDFVSDYAISCLGDCALMREDWELAIERYGECARRIRGTDLHNMLIQALGVVTALAGLGRDSEAIELLAAAEGAASRKGQFDLGKELVPGLLAKVEAAKARLGEKAVAEAERRGRTRDVEDIESWTVSLGQRVGSSDTDVKRFASASMTLR